MVIHPADRGLPVETREQLCRVAECVLAEFPLDGGLVQAVFTTDEHMARMNEEYRGKETTTDVLSFDYGPFANAAGADSMAGGAEWTRGEIYISVERAAQQAEDRGIAPTAELARLLVHGLLHLSGYDHQTTEELQKMEALTDSFMEASGVDETA